MNVEANSPTGRLAFLYQRSVLDPVVEVAHAVARDFVRRPRHYRSLDERTASILEDFRRMGSDPDWLDRQQRSEAYTAIFDEALSSACADLRGAAVAASTLGGKQNKELLETRVRDAARLVSDHANAIDGRAVATAARQIGAVFANAVRVLQDPTVSQVFGASTSPGKSWPLGDPHDEANDGGGAFLVEEIQLALGLFRSEPDQGNAAISRHLFSVLQRIAHYGAATLQGASSPDSTTLTRDAYTWESSIQASVLHESRRFAPRVISRAPIQDETLANMPSEQDLKSAARGAPGGGGGGGGGPTTCLTGWTRVCDTGPTCTYGWTFRCDTGPTCISGWTIVCDTGPTCTYGWTVRCDIPRRSF